MKERKKCNCQGIGESSGYGHDVYANCTSCGYILCVKENEGICFYCNSYVTKNGTEINKDFMANNKNNNNNIDSSNDKQQKLDKAVAFKDRLLSYASNHIARTHVIDDQADFYDMFSSIDEAWLNVEERDSRRKQAAIEKDAFSNNRSKIVLNLGDSITFKDSKSSEIEILSAIAAKKDTFTNKTDRYYKNETLEGNAASVYAALLELRNSATNKIKPTSSITASKPTINPSSKPIPKSTTDTKKPKPSDDLFWGEAEEIDEKIERLDLWVKSRANDYSNANLTLLHHSTCAKNGIVLGKGLVLIKQYFPILIQQAFVDICRNLGVMTQSGFECPSYDMDCCFKNSSNSNSLNLYMMCLGYYWHLNEKSGQRYSQYVSCDDSIKVPPIPESFQKFIEKALTSAQRASSIEQLPDMNPNIAIINFYLPTSGKLGMHQDKDETSKSLERGKSVVSLSIGDSAEFCYSTTYKEISDPSVDKVILESGDLLVFGGASRMLYHGISKIIPNTAPKDLEMRSGRLNLTFREY